MSCPVASSAIASFPPTPASADGHGGGRLSSASLRLECRALRQLPTAHRTPSSSQLPPRPWVRARHRRARHRRKSPELVSTAQNRLASACLSQIPRFVRISSGVDHPREACGVFGVWAPGEPAVNLVFYGLYALQHRGQE